MSFTQEYFIIDNIHSEDIGADGCILVRTDSEINRQIMGSKNIVEENIAYRDIPTFYKTTKSPIEFNLKFCLKDKEITSDILFELGKIFAQDRYVSFQSCDYLGVQFYVIATSINLVTYGTYKGWIDVQLRTSVPYAFSLEKHIRCDLSNITVPTFIDTPIICKTNVQHPLYQDYVYLPKINIDLKGASTGITLTNYSYNGETFGFTGLSVGESLEIDCDLKKVKSSTGLSRINNMINNHNWLKLTFNNRILVSSPCVIEFVLQTPIYI